MNKADIIRNIKAEIGEDYEVKFVEVPKNNMIMNGVSIRKNGEDIAMTAYYHEDDADDKIARDVIATFRNNKPDFDLDDITNNFTDWNWAKDKIVPALYNKTKSVYPDSLLSMDFVSDIAIMFKIVINNNGLGVASIKVDKKFLEKWGVTEYEVFRKAKENLDKSVLIQDIAEMLFDLSHGEYDVRNVNEVNMMSVITNSNKVDGAAAIMLIPDLIKNGELEDKDYYIIPSSIHECIILNPDSINPDDLNAMIHDVNNDVVAPNEVLSDYAMKYDSALREIQVA